MGGKKEMPSRKIVAIGGGQIFVPCKPPETLAIDEEIVRLAEIGKTHLRQQNFLFVPTASDDDQMYCHGMYNVYEARLGCSFDQLSLIKDKLTDGEIKAKIDRADIIYVGGGCTALMMKVWRKHGVDKLLTEACDQGKVMCGLSAGAICWFQWGLSDSEKFTDPEGWKPSAVDGLGLIPVAVSPHWDSEGDWRKAAFPRFLREKNSPGLALEDCCALVVVDDQARLISSQQDKVGYTFLDTGEPGCSHKTRFNPAPLDNNWFPIDALC